MRTTPAARIAEFTDKGWWGADTLTSIFDRTAAACPDRPALVDQFNRADVTGDKPLRLSFAEVAARARALSAKFYAHGLRKDDIVVVQLPNIVELAILYLALDRLGVIVSPVPVQYGAHELGMIRRALEPAAFVSLSRFKGADLAADRRPAFPDDCLAFHFGQPDSGRSVALDGGAPDAQALGELDEYLATLDPSANDIFTICWTSGTTGQPKGVPRTHNMWLTSANTSYDCVHFLDGDVFLNPFPLVNMASIGGFLYNWLNCRGTLVMHHPFDLGVFLAQIEQEKITYTIAPPAVLTMLLKNPEMLASVDLSSVRVIGSGGAPLSPWMVSGFQDQLGIEVINIFGSNEGMCLISGRNDVPDPATRAVYFPRFGVEGLDWKNRVASCIRTRLVDIESGAEITEPGQPGEMLIWGASVFDGYYDSPETNQAVFDEQGYFHTGDMFEIAGSGEERKFYRFIGRCKDIIIRGGVKISPDELDNLLAGHPKVAEVAVVGYVDEVLGERVCAVVAPKHGESLELGEIVEFLKAKQIAVFKLPERLVITDQLPRNPVGKVLRSELREWVENLPS
jgi:acyl-CoA synthetase (AMP-forming)/AMP-acid ligase II